MRNVTERKTITYTYTVHLTQNTANPTHLQKPVSKKGERPLTSLYGVCINPMPLEHGVIATIWPKHDLEP